MFTSTITTDGTPASEDYATYAQARATLFGALAELGLYAKVAHEESDMIMVALYDQADDRPVGFGYAGPQTCTCGWHCETNQGCRD